MIRLVLKHFLYECCINLVFRNIYRNFRLVNCYEDIKNGDIFEEIELYRPKIYDRGYNGYRSVYHGCRIIRKNGKQIQFDFHQKYIINDEGYLMDNTVRGISCCLLTDIVRIVK